MLEHDIFGTKPRKKSINSKKKGNNNEVQAAKWWASWTSYEFQRVPQSGGLRWKDTRGITGDLFCSEDNFPISIETKAYKSLSIPKISKRLRNDSKIYRFWEQALADGKRADREPCLFVRENGMKANTWYFVVKSNLGVYMRMMNKKLNFYMGNGIMIFKSEDVIKLDWIKIKNFLL